MGQRPRLRFRRRPVGALRPAPVTHTEPFDLQPTLAGDLIEIRPLRAGDFDELFRAASDPLIWEQHPEPDRYKIDVFRTFFDGAMASGGAFAVIEKASGRIIGSSRFWNWQPEREVEIGWTFLERRFWGGEYNRELKALMIGHALRFVPRVIFLVGENNVRSQRALQKIGATRAGSVERAGADGTLRRSVVYEIVRS